MSLPIYLNRASNHYNDVLISFATMDSLTNRKCEKSSVTFEDVTDLKSGEVEGLTPAPKEKLVADTALQLINKLPAPQPKALEPTRSKQFLTNDLLQHHIFSFLSLRDKMTCERVSQQFKDVLHKFLESESIERNNVILAFEQAHKIISHVGSILAYTQKEYAIAGRNWQKTAGVLTLNRLGQLVKLQVGDNVLIKDEKVISDNVDAIFRLYVAKFNDLGKKIEPKSLPTIFFKLESEIWDLSGTILENIAKHIATILNEKIYSELVELAKTKVIHMFNIAAHWEPGSQSKS